MIVFRKSVGDFLASLNEFTFEAAGIKASAKRKTEAAAALGAAIAQGGADQNAGQNDAAPQDARLAGQVVEATVTSRVARQASRSRVLWVDDRPSNNIHERHSLEALGIVFVLATSTDQALELARAQSFDAIISDMSRPEDNRGGYTLLEKLRAAGTKTPFIIYAGRGAVEFRSEAIERGAYGITNRADELFELVLSAVGERA